MPRPCRTAASLGAAVGALRIEHRGRGGELVTGEMVVGDDDLDAGARAARTASTR